MVRRGRGLCEVDRETKIVGLLLRKFHPRRPGALAQHGQAFVGERVKIAAVEFENLRPLESSLHQARYVTGTNRGGR